MVEATGAHSTDMSAPETVEHLCGKCANYAKEWAPYADKLWKSNHPGFEPEAPKDVVIPADAKQ